MFCKCCGEKIDDNSLFCYKCGAKVEMGFEQTVQANKNDAFIGKKEKTVCLLKRFFNWGVINKDDITKKEKICNVLQKCCNCGLCIGGLGLIIFIFIIIIGLIGYGKVYLFNGYEFTKVISIISMVLMVVGVIAVVGKFLINLIVKNDIAFIPIAKKSLLIVLAIACLGCTTWGFVDCGKALNSDYIGSGGSSSSGGSSTISMYQAISKAKDSSIVQNAIANAYNLMFYYTPDWGVSTATKLDNGDWEVVLKGNISGYTDEYKTNFVYDKKFTVNVTVSSLGYVYYHSVYKY